MLTDNVKKRLVQTSVYKKEEVVYFYKVKEQYGILSNMSSEFPIEVRGNLFRSSEALYQCCKYPIDDVFGETIYKDIQNAIKAVPSPMVAKQISRSYKEHERKNWKDISLDVMYWVILAKLFSSFDKFSKVLEDTGTKQIIEKSTKDNFWGCFENNNDFIGFNVLGKLIMLVRYELRTQGKDWLEKRFNSINYLECEDDDFNNIPF